MEIENIKKPLRYSPNFYLKYIFNCAEISLKTHRSGKGCRTHWKRLMVGRSIAKLKERSDGARGNN